MTTARDIIKSALKKINVVGVGQSLQSDEANDALDTLNNMLASWSVEGGYVYAETQETFNLSGQQSYTIGDGADFNTSLPINIVSAFTSIGGTDYPIEKYDRVQYSKIKQKSLQGYVPDVYYYDYNFPTAKIYFYPVGTTGTVTFYSEKKLDEFSSLDAAVNLPAGYARALIYNLAVEIAPEYEKEAAPTVKQIAIDSKQNVFDANTRNENYHLVVDEELSGGQPFDIYEGYN